MANGETRPISEIRDGDMVLATDPEVGETGAREVVATLPHTDQLLTLRTSAGEIVTTEDHRYWNESDREWQESQALDLGAELLTAEGDQVTVEGLDWSTVHSAPAYDLDIADIDAFYVNVGDESVLVHNCPSGPLRGSAATNAASDLGFTQRIPPQRAPFNSHGQPAFSDGRRYITPDVDQHSGGVWKMFDRQGNRLGTYDANLNWIGD